MIIFCLKCNERIEDVMDDVFIDNATPEVQHAEHCPACGYANDLTVTLT